MNYYGLSALNDQEYNLKLAFPYNELLWFIKGLSIKEIKGCQVSVQRIVMVYLIPKLNNTKLPAAFPYNELLWFIALSPL